MQLGAAQHATFFLDASEPLVAASDERWRRLGLVLVILGFGTKLGLAPMYSWLPDAYDAAPPATTALLAAVQFNVALVALLRVLHVYGGADAALVSTELVALGLATMALSALNVLAARNYKKLIAYAALNHAGVIAVGLGVGTDATYGVLLYAVSNAFIKAILFLTAGKIRFHYGTEQISGVSGLVKDLPFSGLFFMVGTFALLGLPPFGSFLGELIIMSGLVGSGYLFVFGAFCVILTVTFVATGRAIFPMIWGEPKKEANWGRQPVATVLPKLTFFIALVAMGLYLPEGINRLFRQAAAELGAP
jgi:hydrogenase-4 component F